VVVVVAVVVTAAVSDQSPDSAAFETQEPVKAEKVPINNDYMLLQTTNNTRRHLYLYYAINFTDEFRNASVTRRVGSGLAGCAW